jgi:hypothetical protein
MVLWIVKLALQVFFKLLRPFRFSRARITSDGDESHPKSSIWELHVIIHSPSSWLPFTLRVWALYHPTANFRAIGHPMRAEAPVVTDGTATEVQIDTDPHETMIGTGGHDHAAKALVEGGNRGHVARARSIQPTAVLNRLLQHGVEAVKETTRALIVVMGEGMVVEARDI